MTFGKSGVGLVLDAGRPVKASRVVVTTETLGYAAQVKDRQFADRPVHGRLRGPRGPRRGRPMH